MSHQFYQHDADIYYTNRYYEKVKRIRDSISDQQIPRSKVSNLFQIITDFDRTLTHPLSYQCHGLIAQFSECQAFKDAVNPLFSFSKLFPNKDPKQWWIKYHEAMIEHSFEYHMIEKLISVENRVYMRAHCKQFFHYCMDHNVPILIVSAGISNLIQCILERNELKLPNVHLLANRIFWKGQNSEDCIDKNGFDTTPSTQIDKNTKISHFGPLMTSYNKSDTFGYLKKGYFDQKDIVERRFVIFCGDARTDPQTMNGVKNVSECIFIGFILPHRMNEIDIYLDCYDLVIATKNASMQFVNDLLHAFLNGNHAETDLEEEEKFDDDGDELDEDKVSELTKERNMNHPKTFTHSFSNLMSANYRSDDQQLHK